MFLLPEGSFRDSPFSFSLLFCSVSCCMVQMKLTWYFCSITTLSNRGLSFACDSVALPNKQHVPIFLRSRLVVEIANALVYLLIACILMFDCNYALLFPLSISLFNFTFQIKEVAKKNREKRKNSIWVGTDRNISYHGVLQVG